MLLMQLNWLIIYKEGLYAKKWTKIGPILRAKTMFFLRTRRTLPKNSEKFLTKAISAKPRNRHFWLLKHTLFIQTSHNIIHKYTWTKKLTKKKTSKYQNQVWGTKSKKLLT